MHAKHEQVPLHIVFHNIWPSLNTFGDKPIATRILYLYNPDCRMRPRQTAPEVPLHFKVFLLCGVEGNRHQVIVLRHQRPVIGQFGIWLYSLLVIRSVKEVCRAQSRFVKFVGVEAAGEPLHILQTYFGSKVRQQ